MAGGAAFVIYGRRGEARASLESRQNDMKRSIAGGLLLGAAPYFTLIRAMDNGPPVRSGPAARSSSAGEGERARGSGREAEQPGWVSFEKSKSRTHAH